MDHITVTIGKRDGADKWETIFGPDVAPAEQLTQARELRGKDGWRRLVVLTNKTARWRWSGGPGAAGGVRVKEARNPARCKVEELLAKIHAADVLEKEIDADPALTSGEKYARVKNVRASRKALQQCLKDLRAALAEAALEASAQSAAKKRAARKAAAPKKKAARKKRGFKRDVGAVEEKEEPADRTDSTDRTDLKLEDS